MTQPRPPDRRSRLPLALAVAALVGLAAGAAGIAYMFGGSAPAAVSLSASTPSLPSATASGSGAPGASPHLPSGAPAASSLPSGATVGRTLDGTWTVDTSIGSFSGFSDSFVGYRVNENLAQVGSTTAVGRTPRVSGSLTLAGESVTDCTISADLSTLQSDRSMRDGQLHRQALETDRFPTATFELASPVQLSAIPADGQTIEATAQGRLTLHGVTRDVSIPLKATLSDRMVTVVGSLDIAFADYGIAPPQSMVVLSVDDHGVMEFQLHFTRG